MFTRNHKPSILLENFKFYHLALYPYIKLFLP